MALTRRECACVCCCCVLFLMGISVLIVHSMLESIVHHADLWTDHVEESGTDVRCNVTGNLTANPGASCGAARPRGGAPSACGRDVPVSWEHFPSMERCLRTAGGGGVVCGCGGGPFQMAVSLEGGPRLVGGGQAQCVLVGLLGRGSQWSLGSEAVSVLRRTRRRNNWCVLVPQSASFGLEDVALVGIGKGAYLEQVRSDLSGLHALVGVSLAWGVSCILVGLLLLLFLAYRVLKRKLPIGSLHVHPVHPTCENPPLDSVDECAIYDSKILAQLQDALDSTFRDRPYKGAYTPTQLKLVEAHRVFNRAAHHRYEACRDRIKAKRGSCSHREPPISTCIGDLGGEPLDRSINEYYLFHGTNPAAASAIAKSDFRLPTSHAHGGMYGKGVYLAEASTKAHMYCAARGDGAFPILLVRATLGLVKDNLDEKTNPAAINSEAEKKVFDTMCGDRRKHKFNFSGYREFVVYDPDQAVAELLLWAKKK